MSSALSKPLEDDRGQLLRAVRRLLSETRSTLEGLHPAPEDSGALAAAAEQLDDVFLLVVVGEFNAGKSAFLNALIGSRTLEEGVTPTTSKIQVLTYGEEASREVRDAETDVVLAPVELLHNIRLVDTPGTNAVERSHEAITEHFVPRADLVLFVTSADRPFTESERAFLERVREWGKKIVVVVNKFDILTSEEDWERIRRFLTENFRGLLGIDPTIFPVSARQALEAKLGGDRALLESSRFPALEKYVRTRLDEAERFRLKLLNPLSVAEALAKRYREALGGRLELLAGDLDSLEAIDDQLEHYAKDMRKGFELRLSDVDLILHRFESSGHAFFDEIIRVGRVFDLMNKQRVSEEFERLVVADAPKRIEDNVEEIIDWLVQSDLDQWKAVREHFDRRQSEHADRIVSQLNAGFDYDRSRLLNSIGKTVQHTLENYNQSAEAKRMADSVQNAVANAALLQVGAVGLGAAVSLAATSAAADITGLAAAGTLAAIGFLVLPHKRRRAKQELNQKISALREKLMQGLRTQFESELTRSKRSLEETIQPYTRFVKGERDALTRKLGRLGNVLDQVAQVRGDVQMRFPPRP